MPQPANVPRTSHRASAVPQPIQHTVSARSLLSSSSGFRRSSKVPSTLTELDENGGGMAEGGSPNDGCMSTIDMQIQDRQNFLTKQEQIQKVMTIQHSVLGLRRSDSDDAQNEQPSTPAPLNPDLLRNEAAAPTHDQIIECMYTRPHVVATQAQEHDYAIRTRPPRDAVPQEPLLTHCIIVDPSTLCDSKTVLKRINRAYLALQVGEYDRAIQWCTASLKAEPNHLTKWCHLLRGSVHDLLGDYTDALADFDAATRIDPAFHQAHFNRSVSLLKVGKDDLALDAIVAAQELAVGKADGHPVPTEYVRNHALILRRMGRYDEARLVYATLGSTSVVATASGAPTAAGEVAQTEAAARTGGLGYDSEKEQSLEHMLGNAGFTGGLFDALFCQSKDEKAACRAAPETRSPAMLDLLQSRLHQYDFFARCPPDILRNVCQALHYVVVRSGDTFYLAHDNPHAFYVCVSGTLSVHANLTLAGQDLDTMASSSTHRLRTGDVFGCVGASISSLMLYLADERTEIMYLTPAAFKATLEGQWLVEQHARFNVFRRSPVFRMLSDSDLGHVVSHSILVRFHKGDVIVAQNELPKRLYVLYKGICRVEQSFAHAAAPDTTEQDVVDPQGAMTPLTSSATALLAPIKPYHRYLDVLNWPLGFQIHPKLSTKAANRPTSPGTPSSPGRPPLPANVPSPQPLPTITHDIYPPALFGESAYKNVPEKAKCSVVASTLVEALAVDMHQLKSLNLAKEVFAAVVSNAPLYVDVAKARKMYASHKQWTSVRGKEALQVNKTRWPVHKERLRYIPNGGSIVVPNCNIATDNTVKR
ncbi:hypothetical protein H310_12008 [Aphanomyces invadans]|uniref:Cyclic nucleotide-binding domain-containing protein n=1 Tax=Aphanomyces invadans TaxID=157072 RepID=A0A024TK47_9STRA|nr:hypothetical protein H310_12008 [Aphanomyces invadans]ETV94369.1 hypothetical protein H310_12008 [Aphanomyces invadans]|eukprot:XP_008877132.1 hypothetical protein H310_12008 [Aphanomyces invadans]